MDFSNWTLITSIIVTLLMTATTLLMFKCCQDTSDTQSTESQARLPQRPSSAEDGFNFVLYICRFLGLGPLFSHQYLLMTLLYFQHHVNFIDSNWIFSLIVLISEAAQLLSVGINSYFSPRFTLQKHIMSCLILMSCLLFVLAIVSGTAQLAGETLIGICICVLWLISLFSAMVESHLSENINMLPPEHRRSFEQGQASARTVASVFMFPFLFIPVDVALHVVSHFALAGFVSLLALISYVILIHLDFAKKYFNQNVTCASELQDLNDRKNDNASEDPESPDGNTNCLKNWLRFLGIMIVQTLTFTVYPAITADVHTKYPGGTWERFFTPLCCFLNFNFISCISILIGQKMPCLFPAQKHFLVVFPILVFPYTLFIPVFLFCNVQPRTFHINAYLFNDAGFAFFMFLFSLSKGYLTHLTLQYFQNHNERANMIVRALGSVIGVLLSFGFRAAI